MTEKNQHQQLSKYEKKQLIEQICIVYPRFNRLVKMIDECREYSKISAEPEGMLITGDPGMGKTTLRKCYAAKFPVYQTATETICTVVHVTVPVPATIKGLATALLAALGDLVPEKGTTVYQTRRLVNMITKCKVEIVILDEFQHFLERESSVVLQSVTDWLKNLMNETRVAIVLIGTHKATAVLDAPENSQLRRRFPYRETISSFGWKTTADQLELRTFLQKLDDLLPFAQPSNLADPKLAYCIFEATKGAVHNIMKLIRCAAFLALDNELENIAVESLREAYEIKLSKSNPTVKNPFSFGS